MTAILGISAFYHDSAAALVVDGDIVAAAQEERFSRIKHDFAFPQHAVDYCLSEANLTASQLDAVVFYDKPYLKFERILETYLAFAPRGMRSFLAGMPLWLKQKLHLPREIDKGLHDEYDGPIYFTHHHESHAASAFFPSPFESAAIITLDGVGEWTTTSWGVGDGNRVELKKEIRFPHSLGLLYSAFTYFTGFRVNSGEYKLMGLAPYGEPKYADLIREKLIDIKDDGSFWLNQKYFGYGAGRRMTNRRFANLFGGPARKPESPITQREMDLAASVQLVTEEAMLAIANHVHHQTGETNLCLAGGVALNCVGNGEILRRGPFENIWIQPAAGDAGGALGSALFVWHQIMGRPRHVHQPDNQKGSYLGPAFHNEKVCQYLDSIGASYKRFDDESELCNRIAELINDGKVVGHVCGRMEFGPRALGHRSILGDARSTSMQSVMNLKIKFRESFRPFAPSCLEERVSDYFAMDGPSPYMLLVAPVREDRCKQLTAEQQTLTGIDKLQVPRSDVPAITHVDYSARVQTVAAETAPRYHRILKAFEALTDTGVLINTSFNIRGEPIVCTPQDAYRCFMFTDMDVLVLEDCLCLKDNQPPMEGADEYKKTFKLD
ncbi:MAG: carbamoyltransferase family protein [Planctomycetota bacterium]|jgi:carbamoyltransferase